MAGIGDPVWACGPTSGALSGFDGFVLEPPFHLLVPRGRNVRRIGHVIHTTETLPLIDRRTKFGLATTSPTRAIIEMARFETPVRLTAALDSAIRDGGTTENHLHKRIAALHSKGRHGIPGLLAVIEGAEITRGGHSWLERRFLELCGTWNLPRPTAQEVLTKARDKLVRVDFRFPGTPIVVEVLGYRFHRTVSQMQRDTERMNRLVLDGYMPLQFGYLHIAEQEVWVRSQLAEAFAAAAVTVAPISA